MEQKIKEAINHFEQLACECDFNASQKENKGDAAYWIGMKHAYENAAKYLKRNF